MIQQWIDVTQDILKLPKNFKILQVVKDEKFILEDGMHAHQINDNKIDPKYNISQTDTVSYMLSHKIIKLPQQLSIQQILSIFIEITKHQSLILQGYPLHNTIYTFTYLYDELFYSKQKDNNTFIINTLVNSINCFGSYVYQLHKQSASIKEDDLNITMYSYSTKFNSSEQIVKDFTMVENLINTKVKEQKQMQKDKSSMYSHIILIVKLRKAIHNLIKSMGKYYDNKSMAKIEKDIQTTLNAVSTLLSFIKDSKEINTYQILKGTGIFSNEVSKTLRTHFGPRQLPPISLEQSILSIKNALDQFQLFIPIPSRISILNDKIERISEMPINLWSKSYIKNNLFHKQEHIFNTLRTEDLILNDINDYIPIKDSWKNQVKFQTLIKPTSPVISQVLFRYIGRNSRSFWEVSKIYQDYNVLIHLSNEFDASIFPVGKKQLHVSSWYYNFGLNVMIKQLFIGIQTQLYQHYEYPYVFYLLQNLLAVYDRNSQIFLKKFDKPYQTSFFDDTLNSKKKKKVSQASRKFFSDSIFKKGLHYYVRSVHRILFILVHRKLLQNPFSQQLESVLKNRFRIFKNIYFVRTITYEQYKSDYETICKDQGGYLNQAMQLLKEAKNLFQKIAILQENDCNYKVKQDSEVLTKICVKCSLAVMSLKMGQNNKNYKIVNSHAKYPQIVVG